MSICQRWESPWFGGVLVLRGKQQGYLCPRSVDPWFTFVPRFYNDLRSLTHEAVLFTSAVKSTRGWHNGVHGDSLEITNHPLIHWFMGTLFTFPSWLTSGETLAIDPWNSQASNRVGFFDNFIYLSINKALTNDKKKSAQSPVTTEQQSTQVNLLETST